jgi:hypothetical protein
LFLDRQEGFSAGALKRRVSEQIPVNPENNKSTMESLIGALLEEEAKERCVVVFIMDYAQIWVHPRGAVTPSECLKPESQKLVVAYICLDLENSHVFMSNRANIANYVHKVGQTSNRTHKNMQL